MPPISRAQRRLPVCFWTAGISIALVVGCASPGTRIDRQARRLGLDRSIVEGPRFEHVVYADISAESVQPLHIYLEGDGRPWIGEHRVALDPTPHRAYALELMALDGYDRIYLSRPCYHELNTSTFCNPLLWTSERYSTEVVDSLEIAIRELVEDQPQRPLTLIGYSGGGVLAMLLAERLEATRAVITIAANLDIDSWTEVHGYSPLTGSINPARQPPLPGRIRQLHLAGAADERVPSAIIEAVATRQRNSEFRVYSGFDHTCCWLDIWSAVLSELSAAAEP